MVWSEGVEDGEPPARADDGTREGGTGADDGGAPTATGFGTRSSIVVRGGGGAGRRPPGFAGRRDVGGIAARRSRRTHGRGWETRERFGKAGRTFSRRGIICPGARILAPERRETRRRSPPDPTRGESEAPDSEAPGSEAPGSEAPGSEAPGSEAPGPGPGSGSAAAGVRATSARAPRGRGGRGEVAARG